MASRRVKTKPKALPPKPRESYVPYTPEPLEGDAWNAVLARPDDLSARALLADELHAKGDPRGEYLQLALKDALTADEVETRDALFDRCAPEWLRPLIPENARLAGNVRGLSFERGLVERADLQLRSPEVLDLLAERTTIRHLEVSDYEADKKWIEWLPRHRIVQGLRTFTLETEKAGAAERIVQSGAFGAVETLSLSAALTPALARAIAEHTPRVTSLAIDGVTEAEAIAPLASLHLTALSLGGPLSPAAARAVAALPHLTQLSLYGLSGDVADELLAMMPRLKVLSFDRCEIPPASLARLLSAATSLTELELHRAGLTGASISQVLGALGSSRLTSLSLDGNVLHEEGAAALVKLDGLSRLTHLSLHSCYVWGSGFVALAAAPWPLQHANFGANGFSVEAGTALATGPLCANLRTLSLLSTRLDAAGAKALSTCPWLSELQSLSLYGNRVGTTGLRALIEHLPNVRSLSLGRENLFKGEGLSGATLGLLPKLRDLEVDDVSGEAIAAFVESGHANDLRTASFRYSELSTAAVEALVTLPRLRTLTTAFANIEPKTKALLHRRWPDYDAYRY